MPKAKSGIKHPRSVLCHRDVWWGGWQRCFVPCCCSGAVLLSRERAGAFLPLLPSSFPAALPVGVGLLAGGQTLTLQIRELGFVS